MTLRWTNTGNRRHYQVVSASIFLLAIAAPLSDVRAAGVSSVDVGQHEITVRFDDVVEKASSFLLSGPNRIAIDIGGAEPGAHGLANGMVHTIRQGSPEPDMARIVLDLASPAVVTGGQFSADGRTLKISFRPAGDDHFDAATKERRKLYLPPVAFRAEPPRSKYSLSVPLGPPKPGLPRPKIYGPADRPLVVIDPGHGGHDPGAISPVNGKREKDLTLAIARQIRDELIKSGRVRVALTREDDRFLILKERTAIARSVRADLFISVHADSAPNSEADGATIYTLSEVASDREAQMLAQRENKVDIINGVNLGGESPEIASILVDLAQRETMNMSAGFAELLKREGTRFVPFRDDYHRMAGFAVLKAPDTPSILLEVGYLTSGNDAARLNSEKGQQNIALGIRKAVEIHFAKRLAAR